VLRGALRLAAGTATLAAGGWALRALHGAPAALGASPAAIRAVASRSPHFRDGVFSNVDPTSALSLNLEQQRLVLRELIGGRAATRPTAPIPLESPPTTSAPCPLAVSWLGHSTALIEIDGYRVLTDPVWSERCSPSDAIGPGRMHPPPLELAMLPAVDAIVISHDHYDHLDFATVIELARSQRAPFFVPLGVGAHLRAWGIPDGRIVELDWNERARVDELSLVCVPARHFSGRFFSRNLTLWASWAIVGPGHRAYFAGDTGYTNSFRQIGSDYGPFDVTLMPVGAYNVSWPDIHMNPQEAVRAHLDVNASTSGSGTLVPIHWCTFRLAPHPWDEPAERVLSAAHAAGVSVTIPKPGQRIQPKAPSEFDPWWRL
jgi:L-ascorbate metabolism protein UlaG (beta-lactamase superfamily)